jgi:hypothetical protein
LQIRLDVIDQSVHIAPGYRPTGARDIDSRLQFVAVKFLPATISFFYEQSGQSYLFVGGETPAARQAFPSPSDTVLGVPRVRDLALALFAIGAFHDIDCLLVYFSNNFWKRHMLCFGTQQPQFLVFRIID